MTRVVAALAAALPLVGGAVTANAASSRVPAAAFRATSPATQNVILRGPGATRAVAAVRGRITRELPIVDGVAATVPRGATSFLAHSPGVMAVSPDSQVRFESQSFDPSATASSFVRSSLAATAWGNGDYGKGIGVALLDTGASPVPDLATHLINGPDLSGEGTDIDTFGHGTVMAGLIAGDGTASNGLYDGVAPQATVIAVKAGGANGVADVSTLLAGLSWVSAYASQFNIRVVNLSWGFAPTQNPLTDPIDYAVERLWKQGIVVVASAGNDGPGAGTILSPGDDPLVITAGAYDDNQTSTPSDDRIPAWSSQGPTVFGAAKPDIVAPGRYTIATRSPGSTIETANPQAWFGSGYIRGSGTSEATAVTSGLVALLLSARPNLTPDQVKWLLIHTANPLSGVPPSAQGAGRIQLQSAITAALPLANLGVTQVPLATGLGSLDLSRAGLDVAVTCNGTLTTILGSLTADCQSWNPLAWTGSAWTGAAWAGATWPLNGWAPAVWTGGNWTGGNWTGGNWTGGNWTGGNWTGGNWTGGNWTGGNWTGGNWTGGNWTGGNWTGGNWTGGNWTGGNWTSEIWTTAFWGPYTSDAHPLPGELTASQYFALNLVNPVLYPLVNILNPLLGQ
jgi:serine protease AprX